MKKICYITTIGATIHAFFIPQLKYLQEEGYQVSVICSPDYTVLSDELGGKISYIPLQIPRGISFIHMIRATYKLRRIFLDKQFDLIQYSTPNASLCSSIAGKLAKIHRRNYHMMGLRFLSGKGVMRIILKALEKITCMLSTTIECVSQSNLELAVNEGLFPKDKGCVVWYGSSGGVDLKRFDIQQRKQYRNEIREKYKLKEEEFVFGFAGRITRDKGIEELLEAFIELNQGRLLIIGEVEEPLDEVLYNQSKRNRKIIYTGPVTDIEKYYCAMDVLILPSYREGFGMVIAEAAAMGTPAIVSNIPGPIDVIKSGRTAITVSPKSKTELIESMKLFLSGDIAIDPIECYNFIKSHFDSEELNKKILERKRKLLSA